MSGDKFKEPSTVVIESRKRYTSLLLKSCMVFVIYSIISPDGPVKLDVDTILYEISVPLYRIFINKSFSDMS